MKVENMVSSNGNTVANQFIIKEKNKIIFQSYDTIVCKLTNTDNWNKPVIKITKGQPESKTTAKYLNQFLNMFTEFDNYKKIKK